MDNKEIWKTIKYNNELLEVSTFGNIKRNGSLLKKNF